MSPFQMGSSKILVKLAISTVIGTSSFANADQFEDMADLGRFLFNNESLSKPAGQACVSCHSPDTGFTSPERGTNKNGAVVHGAKSKRAGNRKPPTSAYVTFAEPFTVINGRPGGGTFWDGRATGDAVGAEIFPAAWDDTTTTAFASLLGPAVDQAMGPFLNDVEQNLDDAKHLCRKVKQTIPAGMWEAAWGEKLNCNSDEDITHKRIAFAITAYESSSEVSPFNSKFDQAVELAVLNGLDTDDLSTSGFSSEEQQGFEIYQASCGTFCHAGTVDVNGTEKELFTRPRATFSNIGVPRNEKNPFYDMDRVLNDAGEPINPLAGAFVDLGIAGRDEDGVPGSDFAGREGAFKVPTLRNVGKKPRAKFIKAYSHNGYFKSLESIVHFYNTRDQKPTCEEVLGIPFDPADPMVLGDGEAILMGCWPEAEVNNGIFRCDDGENCKVVLAEGETYDTYCDNPLASKDVGNLCLTTDQEAALVAFLNTLSDQ